MDEISANAPKMQVAAVYAPVLQKHKRFKMCFGGRGAARTQSVARALVMAATSSRKRIWCAREYENSINESSYIALTNVISESGLGGRFYITTSSIICEDTGSEFIFKGLHGSDNNLLSAEKLKAYEDIDIVWIEEAQMISAASFEVLGPTIRKNGSEIICTFNRITETDPVWERYVKPVIEEGKIDIYRERYAEDKHTIIIYATYEDNPWFTEALEIERQLCLKNAPAKYDHTWLGYPSSVGAYKALFPTDLVNAACKKVVSDFDVQAFPVILGLDPNGGGDDKSAVCKRQGFKVWPIAAYSGIKDPLSQANRFAIDLRAADPDGAFCDKMYGDAIIAICNGQLHFDVTPVDFSAEPIKDIYRNKRAEIYGAALDYLYAGGSLPDDPELRQELLATEIDLKASEGGHMKLISKELIRAKLGRSPDKADAFALTFAMPVQKKKRQPHWMSGFQKITVSDSVKL